LPSAPPLSKSAPVVLWRSSLPPSDLQCLAAVSIAISTTSVVVVAGLLLWFRSGLHRLVCRLSLWVAVVDCGGLLPLLYGCGLVLDVALDLARC
jgi:low temperature requirement protein LtrA